MKSRRLHPLSQPGAPISISYKTSLRKRSHDRKPKLTHGQALLTQTKDKAIYAFKFHLKRSTFKMKVLTPMHCVRRVLQRQNLSSALWDTSQYICKEGNTKVVGKRKRLSVNSKWHKERKMEQKKKNGVAWLECQEKGCPSKNQTWGVEQAS